MDQGNCPSILEYSGLHMGKLLLKKNWLLAYWCFYVLLEKSISDGFMREKYVGDGATAHLAGISKDSPLHLQEVTTEIFCSSQHPKDYHLIPIHYNPHW
jgi:hypothetical protein